MAAGGPGARAPIRHAGRTAHDRGPAGPVVAVCRGGRRVRGRVGVAAARGLALMALWERLAGVFGRGARERSEAERILLEALTPGRRGREAIAAARARGADTVLVDTAGRLQTEERPLEELKKVVRVDAERFARRLISGWLSSSGHP